MEKIFGVILMVAALAAFLWVLSMFIFSLIGEDEPLKEVVFKKGKWRGPKYFGLFCVAGNSPPANRLSTTVKFGPTCMYPMAVHNELFTLKRFFGKEAVGITWMPIGGKNKIRLFLSQENKDYYLATSIGDAKIGSEYDISLSMEGDGWVCTVTCGGDMVFFSTSTIKAKMKWGYVTGDRIGVSENMPEEIKYWRN